MAPILALWLLTALAAPGAEPPAAIDRAFARLYNFDFRDAHSILDEHIRADPAYPVTYSVRAAAHLFSELYRLKILETEFFVGDEKVTDKKKLKPDPAVRQAFLSAVEEARQRANARLASSPGDRDAMFALCMAQGLLTDYAMLIDRKYFRSFSLSRQTQQYARKLLGLNPPVYDAYLTLGTVEYVVGSMNFIFRLFVRFDQIQGSKQKGIENLQKVVTGGRYYRPFAKILLSVIYLREKKPAQAQALLAELVREFPENPLLQHELTRVTEQLSRAQPGRGRAR